MRTYLYALMMLAFLATAVVPATSADSAVPPDVGEHFKPFSGTTLDGQPFNLADHFNTGKYIFVEFWAWW